MRAHVSLATASVFLAGLLGACTPYPAGCHGSATTAREIRTLDGLIAESTVAIEKGYRMAPRPASGVNICLGGASAHVGVGFCTDGQGQVPVAIDVATERRKLAGLRAQREVLIRKQVQETMQCGGAT